MKSDYEMTKSLIKRRDEYLAVKRKRAALKLIPKTVVPLFCMAAVVMSVLVFNGAFGLPKVDVSLVAGNTNISAFESITAQDPSLTTAEGESSDDKIHQMEAALSSMENGIPDESSDSSKWENASKWVYAADVLEAVKNDLDSVITETDYCWHFESLEMKNPDCLIESGIIYYLVDPEKEDYASLNFDISTARIFCDPLPSAVIYEIVQDDEKSVYSKHIFGTVYKVVGMEGYVTLLYDGRFWLYRAEKWNVFTAGDRNYYTYISLFNSERYIPSNMVADFNDDYTIYYAFDMVNEQICNGDENNEAVYVAIAVADGNKEAWICHSYPAAPEHYILNKNKMGKIEDTAQNIAHYCQSYKNEAFDFNYYFIYILNERDITDLPYFQRFMYNDKLYLPAEDYRADPDTVLVEETVIITEGSGEVTVPCTVFRVKEERDIIAIFCGSALHYFRLA